MVKLSILVPTVPSRIDAFYPKLIKELLNQIGSRNDIEVIGLFDNKKRTVGEKRQNLLNLANGEYLVFIDDDDRISKDYVIDIMNTIETNPSVDCIVFNCICSIEGGYGKLCKYGIEFEYGDILDGKEWRGKPAHTMVYKSSIAKKHSYISSNFGEDINWVKRASQDIKTQVRIDKVLYYYDCKSNTTSETRNIPDNIINENIQRILNQ